MYSPSLWFNLSCQILATVHLLRKSACLFLHSKKHLKISFSSKKKLQSAQNESSSLTNTIYATLNLPPSLRSLELEDQHFLESP